MTTVTDLPASLRWAVWLLAAEAALAGGLAVMFGVQGVAAAPESVADAFALAGFTGLAAAALVGVAVALARRKPRARAPAIVLQLLVVMSAWVLVSGGLAVVGVPVAGVAIAVATLLLAPGSNDALAG